MRKISITPQECEKIIKKISEIGEKYKHQSIPPLNQVTMFRHLFPYGKYNASNLKDDSYGIKYKDLLTNYLYLNAVLDQGGEIEGVRLFLKKVTNRLYENGILFLHEPIKFFENIDKVIEIIQDEHKKIKELRKNITKLGNRYSLLSIIRIKSNQVAPYVLFSWGTPLANLHRLRQQKMTLLARLKQEDNAEKAANFIKRDQLFGLGRAIGDKASHLFIKWLIYTFKIIDENSPQWGQNSYNIPINSNAGRVLMRTGFIFNFIPFDHSNFQDCLTKQADGRINLAANNLLTKKVLYTEPITRELQGILAEWGRRKIIFFPLVINGFVKKLTKQGIETSIGQIDDGIIYIGTTHCFNTNPRCQTCELKSICKANIEYPELKEKYYCGVGRGVFWGA